MPNMQYYGVYKCCFFKLLFGHLSVISTFDTRVSALAVRTAGRKSILVLRSQEVVLVWTSPNVTVFQPLLINLFVKRYSFIYPLWLSSVFSVAQLGARRLKRSRTGVERLQQHIHCHPPGFSWLPRSIIKHKRWNELFQSEEWGKIVKMSPRPTILQTATCFCVDRWRATHETVLILNSPVRKVSLKYRNVMTMNDYEDLWRQRVVKIILVVSQGKDNVDEMPLTTLGGSIDIWFGLFWLLVILVCAALIVITNPTKSI